MHVSLCVCQACVGACWGQKGQIRNPVSGVQEVESPNCECWELSSIPLEEKQGSPCLFPMCLFNFTSRLLPLLLVTPLTQPSPFSSERVEAPPEHPPTLVHQVSAGLGTSSPTEAEVWGFVWTYFNFILKVSKVQTKDLRWGKRWVFVFCQAKMLPLLIGTWIIFCVLVLGSRCVPPHQVWVIFIFFFFISWCFDSF
jgi:hypothetical protein